MFNFQQHSDKLATHSSVLWLKKRSPRRT